MEELFDSICVALSRHSFLEAVRYQKIAGTYFIYLDAGGASLSDTDAAIEKTGRLIAQAAHSYTAGSWMVIPHFVRVQDTWLVFRCEVSLLTHTPVCCGRGCKNCVLYR